ncbi:uncharacterized protein DNG_05595 [Cephalotrichum gorgonifer]|uniref:Uncharacterized protein n=1 Tax=Cephalotrichum gorgonifer TaxID=2041049 RepID=A0AAE8MYL0_9PEZI|nr:uncharacterized protein DNG_05595 [Cephalotrichum gorgonifer]
MAPPTQPGKILTADEQKEAQLVGMLERLDSLHIGIKDLRTLIPRMTQPLTTAGTPPETYAALIKSVAEAKAEIQLFEDFMEKGGFAKLFDFATKRRREDPSGITPWDPTEHPDWYEHGRALQATYKEAFALANGRKGKPRQG